MKEKIFLFFEFLMLLLIACTINIEATTSNFDMKLEYDFISNEVIVIMNNEESLKFIDYDLNYFAEVNCVKVEDMTSNYKKYLNDNIRKNFKVRKEEFRRILKLTLIDENKINVLEAVKKLNLRNDVFVAEPNYYMPIKNDINIKNQNRFTTEINWGLNRIRGNEANSIMIDNSNNVKVGIVDTGIYTYSNFEGVYYHEDLQGMIGGTKDFTNGVANNTEWEAAYDNEGHGTFVASIIGAVRNNNKGIDGVYNNLELYIYKVGISNYMLDDMLRLNILPEVFNCAIDDDVYILNMSLGMDLSALYEKYSNQIYQLQQSIVNYPGIIICGAGNNGINIDEIGNEIYPACYEYTNIITVGASGYLDTKFESSNYGLNSVDLFAPGESIYGATIPLASNNNELYTIWSGTSFSTAYVTGAVAMLVSSVSELTPCMIKQIIMSTVAYNEDLSQYCASSGVLDVYEAIEYVNSIRSNIVNNNIEHLYYCVEYYNDLYHIYRCICNNNRYEAHSWANVVREFEVLPTQKCIVCGATKIS